MDNLNEWFPVDNRPGRAGYKRHGHKLANGVTVSVQGSESAYCKPRRFIDDLHRYSRVEIAVISADGEFFTAETLPALEEFGWDGAGTGYPDQVAAYVKIGKIPAILAIARAIPS